MKTSHLAVSLPKLSVDRSSPEHVHHQLCMQLRHLILEGELKPGTRLPSSDALSEEIGCARNTIVKVYDQLISEGFMIGVKRSGTYVASDFDPNLLKRRARQRAVRARGPSPIVSAYARTLSSTYYQLEQAGQPFALAGADVTGFPFDIWGRIAGQIWRRPSAAVVMDRDSRGFAGLRQAIADYLSVSRGLSCDPQNVIVTSGATQAIDLILRFLLEPGDTVWVEEPGYMEGIDKMRALGIRPAPIPVDEEGLIVAEGLEQAPQARMAFLTPSHQFPTGAILTLGRRLEILEWARRENAWIVEDDYDGEFRYIGRPLPALKSMDRDGVVIYMGTFSKVLFDGLRLGFLVLPDRLTDLFVRARRHLDLWPPIMAQVVLARFIQEGHFAVHLQRMRRIYAARREALITHGKRELEGLLDFGGDQAGLHVTATFSADLARRMSDVQAAERAAAHGVIATPIANCCQAKPQRPALVLGYATVTEERMLKGIRHLASALAR